MAKAELTKREFLDAGARIVEREGFVARLPKVTVQQLLEELDHPLTRGAFHHIWARKDDYDRDLIEYYLSTYGREHQPGLLASSTENVTDNSAEDSILELLAADLGSFDDHATTMRWIGLASCAYASERRGELQRTYARLEASYGEVIDQLMSGGNLRLRRHFTISDVARVVSSLVDGFSLRAAVSSGNPEEIDRIASTFGPVLRASVLSLLEVNPAESGAAAVANTGVEQASV